MGQDRIRRFYLQRDEDQTGVSGTGRVAEGVVWSNGWVSMMWLTDTWSLVTYPDLASVRKIHGHGGRTRIEFEPGDEPDESSALLD